MKSVQEHFFNCVTQRKDSIAAELLDHPNVSAREGLAIYQRAYRIRLKEFLGADFPQTLLCLESIGVLSLLDEYIESFPPDSKLPDEFTLRFPNMLRALPESFWARGWEYVPSMALVERALVLARHTAPPKPLSLGVSEGALANLTQEAWLQATFEIHPSVFLIEATWNLLDLYNDPICRVAEDENRYFLVCGDAVEGPVMQELGFSEFSLLKSLTEGKTLATALERMREGDVDPATVGLAVGSWSEQGLVVKVNFSGT